MTFTAAALFQWVNPKAWAMAVTCGPLCRSGTGLLVGADDCAVFGLTNFPCVSTWAGFGVALRNFLSDPVRLKWFSIVMALLLVARSIRCFAKFRRRGFCQWDAPIASIHSPCA